MFGSLEEQETVPAKRELKTLSADDGATPLTVPVHYVPKLSKKAQKLHEDALAEDPNAFAYDEVFEDIQTQRNTKKQAQVAAKAVRKSRYIEKLLETAKDREIEQSILYERSLLKERKLDDEEFKDKEKFVTSGYKQKLIDDKRWLERDSIREKKNALGGKTNFLQNMLAQRMGVVAPKKSIKEEKEPKAVDNVVKSTGNVKRFARIGENPVEVAPEGIPVIATATGRKRPREEEEEHGPLSLTELLPGDRKENADSDVQQIDAAYYRKVKAEKELAEKARANKDRAEREAKEKIIAETERKQRLADAKARYLARKRAKKPWHFSCNPFSTTPLFGLQLTKHQS